MPFNGHVERLATLTVALVNALTPGLREGREAVRPGADSLPGAVREALGTTDYTVRCTAREAAELVPWAARSRQVIEHLDAGDLAAAAREVNAMLEGSGARPRLDTEGSGQVRIHFHGPNETFAAGWSAGLAAGLAMAIGGDLVHRFGVCRAPACDRVWVDFSKNAHRQFCSQRCQSRVKAAAYRRRQVSR